MEFMLGGIEVDGSGWPATADRGRYVVPDLPRANYKVWVRGYGLLDRQGQHAVGQCARALDVA